VFLAGSFNGWQPAPMRKSAKSAWYADLPLEPGRHEYRFIVDGVWQEDPNAREQTPNSFGSRNSVLLLQ